jgi:hypothetical protein
MKDVRDNRRKHLDSLDSPSGDGWRVTKQKSHADGIVLVRWIVHRPGELRGICECWEESDAQRIAVALNDSCEK